MTQEQKTLADLLMKNSGEPIQQTSTPRPPRHTAALRRAYAEAPQGQCPQCGYKTDLADFETDSPDSDADSDNDNSDDNDRWETADEATESRLASRLLKLAGASNKQKATKPEPKLTREQVQSILNAAVVSLRSKSI